MNKDSDYWRDHWQTHSKLESLDPQIQVARTKFGIPIANNEWNRTCEYIISQMQLHPNDTVLDLCCGNGLLSAYLIEYVSKIYSIDYSSKLLDNFVINDDRIIKVLSDVLNYDFHLHDFDSAVLYFAAQHFNESDLIFIADKIYKNMRDNGVFLIGDIPDINRKWDFFYKKEFRSFYFSNLEKRKPAVGTWYEKKFFEYLAEHIGFSNVIVQDQPEFMINSNHRFDVLFVK